LKKREQFNAGRDARVARVGNRTIGG
jgi:hypothetical protein